MDCRDRLTLKATLVSFTASGLTEGLTNAFDPRGGVGVDTAAPILQADSVCVRAIQIQRSIAVLTRPYDLKQTINAWALSESDEMFFHTSGR